MTIKYKDAGVDIDAGDELVERIKPLARSTRIPEVVADVGGFAGLCSIPSDIEEPLLVSGTDGVGTKLKIAFLTRRHDTVGIDLVAMCVNDVVTCGARPLFFLDYFGCGALDVGAAEAVISGIAEGCRQAGCALLGGETAELPGMYAAGEYDLAGFAVGVVGRRELLGPQRVARGDALIAVASTGLHSNGYSLARRVLLETLGLSVDSYVAELGATLGDVLLTPTRIYARTVSSLTKALGSDLHALCHVTGGGISGNLPRVLPRGTRARFRLDHERPPIFGLIARGGPVVEDELRRTFNLGVGLVVVLAADRVDVALATLAAAGERAWPAGEVIASDAAAPDVIIPQPGAMP
ncbi:MAG: phosphoribosylformylglycinamidine cyclo-ligase [Polyangiaceae bacterium]|nr:phosphoribosylformylglycinamidine cyclo-ligase [Polyangiaceae bacterium]